MALQAQPVVGMAPWPCSQACLPGFSGANEGKYWLRSEMPGTAIVVFSALHLTARLSQWLQRIPGLARMRSVGADIRC